GEQRLLHRAAAAHHTMVGQQQTIALADSAGRFQSQRVMLSGRDIASTANLTADDLRLLLYDYRDTLMRAGERRGVEGMRVDNRAHVGPAQVNLPVNFQL